MLLSVQKIELKNFMTHRQESVELPQSGTVLLWGPSGAGKCLTAGTTVWTGDGTPVSIRQMVLGRFDTTLGIIGDRVEPVRVTDWHQLGPKPTINIELVDGTQLICADTHPVLTPAGCMQAGELMLGMSVGRAEPQVGDQRRWVEIKSLTSGPEMECYDITVDTPEHLYLAEGVVVHNSSLLDSIGFALYGLNATRASNLEELRHQLYPDDDFGVRVTLSLGEGKIQIFRGVEGGKSVVWMVDQDGTMTESPRAVAQQVDDLMGGMDSATFFATYVAQQGELDALVRMAGGGRRKFIQRMMGITLLDKVTTKINRELVKTGERIKFLDESMPELSKRDLLAQVAQAEQDFEGGKTKIEALVAELEAVKIQGEGLARKLAKWDEVHRAATELAPRLQALEETRIPALQAEGARLTEEAEQIKTAQKRLGETADLGQRIAGLEAQAESLSGAEGALVQLGELEAKHMELKALAAELPKDEGGEQHDLLQSQLEELRRTQTIAERNLLEARERLEALSQEDDCWVCGQTIPDPEALRTHLQEEINKLETGSTQTSQKIKETSERLEISAQAKTLREALEQSEKDLREARDKSAGADAKQLQKIRQELQSLAADKAKREADQQLAAGEEKLQQALLKKQEEIKAAKEELATGKAKLAELAYDPEVYEQLRGETEAARGRYVELRDQAAALRESGKELQLAARAAQAAADQYDAIQADRAKAERRHGLLKRLETSIKDFKSHLIGQIRPTLQTLTSQHLSALTDGRMSGVEIDEEYNLSVHDGETLRRIGMCSGGEQARAAFALRLALTQLVSKRTDTPVGFMIFDEIFGSQDEEHRRAILESLRYLRGIYPQVLLISHESTLRESDLIDVLVDVPDSDSAGRIQVTGR